MDQVQSETEEGKMEGSEMINEKKKSGKESGK